MKPIDSRGEIGQYVFLSKYSKFNRSTGKKETWQEAVRRVLDMHLAYYSRRLDPKEITYLKNYMTLAGAAYMEKRILGAQRALQYGGELLLEKHPRMYNCAGTYADRVEVFKELTYLLLCGAGTGYSVQRRHVEKLPIAAGFNMSERKKVVIPDTIEGWAEAVDAMMRSFFFGDGVPDYDYSLIRPKGAYIRGGFRAPGHLPLKGALDKIFSVLRGIRGRRLTPFEVHHIMCICANAVVSGGVRRSAMISLFDADDAEMANCKTGNWMETMPELCRCNNSAVILPDTPKEQFDRIFESVKAYGEPGFVFLESPDFMLNPCFTGDTLIAVADGRNAVPIEKLVQDGMEFPVYSGKWVRKAGHYSKKWKAEIKMAKAFKTGRREVVEVKLSDGSKFKCTPEHRLALPDGTYLEAFKCVGKEVQPFFTIKEKYRTICSRSDGHARQYRMIWEFFNGKAPDGFDIDHIENGKGDFLDNLHLLERNAHQEKSGSERLGKNNPAFRIKNKEAYSHNMSISTTLERNGRYKGLSNRELYEIAKQVHKCGMYISCANCNKFDSRFPRNLSKNRFGGKIKNLRDLVLSGQPYVEEVDTREYIRKEKPTTDIHLTVESVVSCGFEDVYDLTVEDNHNFYIITNGDENYENCSGILVHNCAEVGMYPKYQDDSGEWHSGWGFCNLVEINGGKVKTENDFYLACEAAAIIATLQAGYTDFAPMLTEWSERIARRDALIGVGITGICENPDILLNPNIQKNGALIVRRTNETLAKLLHISPAARCTVVKPSGNSSQLLGTLSGITPGHSRHYIRHIQANDTEQCLQEFERVNPEAVEPSVWNPTVEKVISFPVTLPENTLIKKNLTAVQFLRDVVLLTKRNWIDCGRNPEHPSTIATPKLSMNVSNTCVVREGEWGDVREFLWENRNNFSGVSLLPATGDLDYPQAPFMEVLSEEGLVAEYGSGAILSSGLIVDALEVFSSIWEACEVALGRKQNLLEMTNEEIASFVVENITDGHFIASIDGVSFSDINCVLDYLRNKIAKRKDWIRRFNNFANRYMEGDRVKTSHCLKHVDALHRWCVLSRMRSVDYSSIKWDEPIKEAGSEVATACAGGSCEVEFKRK